jgi:hypothetical protein
MFQLKKNWYFLSCPPPLVINSHDNVLFKLKFQYSMNSASEIQDPKFGRDFANEAMTLRRREQ